MDCQDFLSNLNDNLISKSVDTLKNEEFSSEVASGKIKFLTVIESLQGVLTNENISIRERGIEFLSWLLSQLPKELFNSSEISVLVNFYCDCLKGHHNFISSANKGLLELVKMKQITKEDLVKILVNLFQHVNCQTQLQPDRLILYSILQFYVENCLGDLKQMGPDFVYGLISFIEGEADPFCLIKIFKFLPLFIKNFELGHLSEEVFEMLSCYFPIDFNASPKENITVTREDLSEALHECLSASESFSEQSIPLILDKADSTYKNAKVDSYKLLGECCKTLKVEILDKHINHLWKVLSKDVLPGNDKQVCDAGLSAITDLLWFLSKDESHHIILTTFLDDILMTVRSLTNRIDENMFQPAIRVLIAAASSSKPAAVKILCHLKTFSQLEQKSTPMEKKIALMSFLPFLKICSKYKIMNIQSDDVIQSYSQLVTLYMDAAVSVDFETRKLAFMGILEILTDSNFEIRKRVFDIFLDSMRSKDDVKISNEFGKIWRNLAQNHELELHNFISESFQGEDAQIYFSNFSWALSLIADLPKLTGCVIPTFMNALDSKEKYIPGLESFLNACRVSKANDSSDFFHVIHSKHNVLERLILWSVRFTPKEELQKSLHLLSEIIGLVTRNQNPHDQQTIVDKTTHMFLADPPQLNGSGDSSNLVQSVLILEAVLGSVLPEIKIPMISKLRDKLTSLALNSFDDSVRLSSSRLLATFANKTEESLALDLLSEIHKDIFKHLEEPCELRVKLNSSFLFTWVVKGVILRGARFSDDWISAWFDLLGRKDIGEAIAEGFRTVIEEDNLYLNLDSHCNVRVLYRQRLFGSHPKLVKLYETSDESVRLNYLLALVRLLQGVPIHLIQTDIASIITVLVHCLDTEKAEVLLTTLEIITELLENREKIFSDHIRSFVPRILKLTRFENYMKIRINALKCLYFYGFYPTDVLLPVKNQVIRDLEICLDDKKRLARKEAVRARCRWFLVGAPGEDILDS